MPDSPHNAVFILGNKLGEEDHECSATANNVAELEPTVTCLDEMLSEANEGQTMSKKMESPFPSIKRRSKRKIRKRYV